MRTPSGGRARIGALAVALAGSALLLSGCIGPPVTASGSGVVTVSWGTWSDTDEGAEHYTPSAGGDRLALCAEGVESCHPTVSPILYFYDPAQGDTTAVLSVDTVVTTAGGTSATIPSGRYTLQALGYDAEGQSAVRGGPLQIYIGTHGTKDLTTWLQSVSRRSADTACPRGYTPSWDTWPNEGTGGHVCNRTVYAYYPDEPVRGPDWDSAAPEWLWSVERTAADAPCPEGFDASWAQWPRDGAGGYVCVGTAE